MRRILSLLFLLVLCVGCLHVSKNNAPLSADDIKQKIEKEDAIFGKALHEKFTSKDNFPKGEKLRSHVTDFLTSYNNSPVKYRLARVFVLTVEDCWRLGAYEPSEAEIKELGLLKLMRAKKIIEFAQFFHQTLQDRKIAGACSERLTQMALDISPTLFVWTKKLCDSYDPYRMEDIFNPINSVLIEGGVLVLPESSGGKTDFVFYKIPTPRLYQTVTLKSSSGVSYTVPIILFRGGDETSIHQGFSLQQFPSAIVDLAPKIQMSLGIYELLKVPTNLKLLEANSMKHEFPGTIGSENRYVGKIRDFDKIKFETVTKVFKGKSAQEISRLLLLSTILHELTHGFDNAFGYNDQVAFSQAEVSANLGQFSMSETVQFDLISLADMAVLGVVRGHESYSNQAARTIDFLYASALKLDKIHGPPLSLFSHKNQKRKNELEFRFEVVLEQLYALLELTPSDLHVLAAEVHKDVFKCYPPIYQKFNFNTPMPFDSFDVDLKTGK